jgi:hypothetical protein
VALSDAQTEVAYELLGLAVEQPVGLVEIRNQWPRGLIVQVLVELIANGSLVIGSERDITTTTMPTPDRADVRATLENPVTWEPSVEGWRTFASLAVLATTERERAYRRLATNRP